MDNLEEIVSRAQTTEHGFKDLQLAADEIVASRDREAARDIALTLLHSEVHQARCVGTFVLGRLAAADPQALAVLKAQVSEDHDWRVQEMLAKAFDRFCADTGYEAALPVIREWLSASSPNTRRAVTEGLRIWTSRPFFRDHPTLAIDLLASRRADESEYLRKSVGNALRDIGKKHPELLRQEVAGWDLTQRGVPLVYKLATRLIFPDQPDR
jgi:3-methyladenine DNA glycosylase AlkC